MKTQEINDVKNAAKDYFPTITKMYPNRIQIIRNSINGRFMYIMPVKIGNGASGMFLNFSMYVDKEIR